MSIVPRFTYGALDLTDYPFSVEFGSDFGNPENVVDVVQTLLHDGEVLESNRRTNRTLTIPVMIDCSDMQELADAEASLIAECDKPRNTLAVEPGDGIGATTVFETFRAQPRWTRNDDEEQGNVRRYVLEIPALPHPRSVDKITDDADTPPSDPGTVVNSCESTAGWSYWFTDGINHPVPDAHVVDSTTFYSGTGSIKGDASRAELNLDGWDSLYYSTGQHWDQVTGLSLNTGTGGYLSVMVRLDYPLPGAVVRDQFAIPRISTGVQNIYMQVSGGAWQEVSFVASDVQADGWVRHLWAVADGLTVTGLRFYVEQARQGSWPEPKVRYDAISLSTSASTDNQITKTLTVEGSARTTGSLHIASPIDGVGLGNVLAMTYPADDVAVGFNPDVRRWVTSGATTADASELLFGSYFSTTPTFEVPAHTLKEGPYSVVALVKDPGSTFSAGVTAQLVLGGSAVGPTSTASVSTPTTGAGWRLVTVGTVYLPPLPVDGADNSTAVRLVPSGAFLAEMFLVPATADFTIVACGAGAATASGPSSHLWIDSPSVDQPRGGYWRGPAPARQNARSAWPDVKKPGRHSFKPGGLVATVVATNAEGPTVTLDYWPAWYSNAAL